MGKSINVHEACVITKDDKGNLSMVGKAKEALTTLKKNKVSVCILLCDNKKEDVEKFLNDNNVPFASLSTKEETDKDGNTKHVDPQRQMSPSCQVPRSSLFETIGSGVWMILPDAFGERKRRRIRKVSSSAWMTAWLITYAGQHQKMNQIKHLVLLSDNIAPTSSKYDFHLYIKNKIYLEFRILRLSKRDSL